jgi:hypothetical protein
MSVDSPPPLTPSINSAASSWPLSSEIVIGLLAPLILLGILGNKALADLMIRLGWVSEQLYRGERLPTLNISDSSTSQPR